MEISFCMIPALLRSCFDTNMGINGVHAFVLGFEARQTHENSHQADPSKNNFSKNRHYIFMIMSKNLEELAQII